MLEHTARVVSIPVMAEMRLFLLNAEQQRARADYQLALGILKSQERRGDATAAEQWQAIGRALTMEVALGERAARILALVAELSSGSHSAAAGEGAAAE
jgi:hypothetical protein